MNLALPIGIGHNQEFNITVRLSAEPGRLYLVFSLTIILQILRCSAPNNDIRKTIGLCIRSSLMPDPGFYCHH